MEVKQETMEFWMAFGFWIIMVIFAVYSLSKSVYISLLCIAIGTGVFLLYLEARKPKEPAEAEEVMVNGSI